MHREEILAAFDEQVRRNPRDVDARLIERDGRVVRVIGEDWAGISWSDLDEHSADAAIAAQLERFKHFPGRWEWKHYSYDRPVDLPRRLRDAGLRAEPSESLLVADLAHLHLDVAPPEGVELACVQDETGVRALVRLQAQVFGDEPPPGMARTLIAGLSRRPPAAAAVLALADGVAVAGGRMDLPAASDFAGLWGGCTLPAFRRRGIFRAVVARRAALAAQRGYRWLYVDAADESRPILRALGFLELAKTTPFVPLNGGR